MSKQQNELDREALNIVLDAAGERLTDANEGTEEHSRLKAAMDRLRWSIATPSPEEEKLDEAYRKAACDQYHREGECEIDEGATVSKGEDPGAYVQAWVWVSDSEAGLDASDEEDEEED